jgi:lysophospholipase L1-like esterase
MSHYTYLALGDSYTIGEGVLLADNFPYQAVELLRRMGFSFCAPEIIAATGWTADELMEAIEQRQLLPYYNIVSVLVGVNNQYRGRSAADYVIEFEALIKRAIKFANGKTNGVFVLSIPDWGVTPFAANRDKTKISEEIDAFNAANAHICGLYCVEYINITLQQRIDGGDSNFLAADKLHPSAKEYARWAYQLSQSVAATIKSLNGEF